MSHPRAGISSGDGAATDLPTFRLEEYLGVWEFAGAHYLTASDAETLTVEELLDLGGPRGARARSSALPLSYAPTWGGEELRDGGRRPLRGARARARADLRRRRGGALLGAAGAGRARRPRARHRPQLPVLRVDPAAAGAEVEGIVLDPGAGWALDVEAIARAAAAEHEARRGQLPQQPDRRDRRPRRLRGAGRALRRARGDAALRRGLPRARDARGSSRCRRRPSSPTGRLAQRDVEVLRAAGAADRLARDAATATCSSGSSGASTTPRSATRPRASSWRRWRCATARRIQARNRAIIAKPTLPHFEAVFAAHPERLEWQAPAGGCVSFPRYLGEDGVEEFCRELVETAGVVLLPASVYASRARRRCPATASGSGSGGAIRSRRWRRSTGASWRG